MQMVDFARFEQPYSAALLNTMEESFGSFSIFPKAYVMCTLVFVCTGACVQQLVRVNIVCDFMQQCSIRQAGNVTCQETSPLCISNLKEHC